MPSPAMEPQPSDNQPLIAVRNLVKAYKTPAGEVTVIKSLDLGVRRGAFVAIIGKSGSGKSTFSNMLTGIDRPTSGQIVMAGAPIHAYNEGQLAAWRGRQLGIALQRGGHLSTPVSAGCYLRGNLPVPAVNAKAH